MHPRAAGLFGARGEEDGPALKLGADAFSFLSGPVLNTTNYGPYASKRKEGLG